MSDMRRGKGFTLLEVLIAMSLFTVIGFSVVVLMTSGVEMWLRGTRGSRQEDRLEQSLPRFAEDLRNIVVPSQHDRIPYDPKNPDPEKVPEPLPPENRMVSGFVNYQVGDVEYACRYIAFVRQTRRMPEVEIYESRAGKSSNASAYIDGVNDEEEFRKNDHLPTGGEAEVLWIWLPDENRPGLGAVYRAYRSPVGGRETLLDPANFRSLRDLRDKIRPLPMFQDVLRFDVYFWTQFTTRWDWQTGDPVVTDRPRTPEQMRGRRPDCGPSRSWDSTRGLLPKEVFGLSRGTPSFNFSGDDIWPRMVRVEFALKEEETRLTAPLSGGETEVTVESGEFATGRGELVGTFMKIGAEWVRVRGRNPSARDRFQIDLRGQKDTKELVHPDGTPVYHGRMFDFTVTVPAFRDDNN
jgi:prepilin-type N-terminal cleavage/methylation domain-containing protein